MKGGSIEFDIIANNGQINSSLKETERRITGFSKTTVAAGDRINEMFDATRENIEIQKRVIKDLEAQYKKLQGEIAKLQPGKAQAQLYREAAQVRQELDAEKAALIDLEAQVNKTENAHTSFRQRLREVREALAQMEMAGETNTREYKELRDELGRLSEAMDAVTTQANILKKGEKGWEGLISVVSGITGAFSAAQGAVSLFAGENENLQRIMVKIQSLMAISMGLREVQLALDKDEAFQLVILTKAKQAFSAATLFAGKALVRFGVSANVARVAATALTATLTLGLSLAITAAVAGINKLIKRNEELKKKQEEARKAAEDWGSSISQSAAPVLTTYMKLRAAWKDLGDDVKGRSEFIKAHQNAFDELGVSLQNMADADKLFIEQTDSFVAAVMKRATASAYESSMQDKISERIALESTAKYNMGRTVVSNGDGKNGSNVFGFWQFTQADIDEAFATKESLQKFYNDYLQFTKEVNGEQVPYGNKGKNSWLGTAGNFAEFTVGNENSVEQAQQLRANVLKILRLYEDAQSDAEAAAKAQTEAESLMAKLAGGGNTGSGGGTKTNSDPFTEQLNQRKKAYEQYFKWVNSKDEILQQAAKTEFSGILAEGSNYLDYLNKQRAALLAAIGEGAGTKEQQENLRKLNDAIADETKATVLADFDAALQEQLNGANSIFEKLALLEEKRKELSGDGSDLDNGKKAIVEEAEQEVAADAQQQTQQLLDEYAGYLSEKIEFEATYAEKSRLLNKATAEAKTEDERKIAEAALAALNKKRDEYSVTPEQTNYEELKKQYKSYQQEIADITAEYDGKIALAQKNNNAELVAELEKEKAKALSSAAVQQLQDSGAWSQLFGNLDDLTSKQITELIAKIEAQRAQLGVELSPEDLQAVLDKLQAAKDEVETRNPFKALSIALKDYKKDASKANLSEVFSSLSSSIDLIKGTFDAVTQGLASMGLAGDEITQDLLGDISNMVGAAGQLASGIATGNPLSIIQGSIGLITSAFEVFNVKDRKAERAIKSHAEAVTTLEKEYKALEHAVDKALGESVYDNQKALISNMRQQQLHLQEMWEAEEGKKKSDSSKVDEYKEQYAELGRQIEDTIAEIAQSITQTSAKDLASQLSDAIAETFTEGFNSAKVDQAIEKVVQQVMQNAVKNALKLQFLEGPLQAAIAQLQKDMGFDEEGNGSFDGLTEAEQDRFRNKVKEIAASYTEALKLYEDLFKELGEETGDPTSTMAGAIKGASQESIDLLAGQTNAVRVNQVVEIDILRQQLIRLASIDNKIGVSNQLLRQIYDEVKGYSASDPLRAQGITQ